jgi:hypothetical protein
MLTAKATRHSPLGSALPFPKVTRERHIPEAHAPAFETVGWDRQNETFEVGVGNKRY